MRKALLAVTMVLLALPAFAQDDFGGGFGGGFDGVLTGGDIDALLGGGNRGNRGNNNNSNNIPNPEQLFLQLKDLLKARKVPLTKDQEKSLRTFLDTETTTMRTDLEAQFQNRGGNRGNNNTVNVLAEIFGLVTKHNTELLTQMKADLTPDQVNLITKAEKDKKVCSVMMDMFNPQQLQNRNQGNRGGNNNQNFNLPIGIDGFEFGGGQDPRQRGNNNNNSFLQAIPDRTFCTTSTSTTAERLAPISQILSKGKKPLTADQEKKFSGLIEAQVPVMQQEMREKDPRMASLINDINNSQRNNNNNNSNNPPAVNPQQLRNNIVNTIMTQLGLPNSNNNNNNNRGGRGGNNTNNAATPNNANAATPTNANAPAANNNDFNRGGRGNNNNNFNNNFNPQAEIQKKNEELYDKIAAKLNPDQADVIKKLKYDQIKAKGGAERYRGIMEQEGTPLTPEQVTQIQSLFNVQNRAVREFAEQMVQQEMDKAATLEPPPPPANQQNQNRPNPNNVAQNPVAQQIVAKVMPEVSRRHAILERSLNDTIMKVLTPAQVASYKLNSL
ncbi:MAG TPA: hypothetical protein VFR18_25365 [Terriglobia bacterium]|nr:hypothetical protein [Terriglobia bacterium]